MPYPKYAIPESTSKNHQKLVAISMTVLYHGLYNSCYTSRITIIDIIMAKVDKTVLVQAYLKQLQKTKVPLNLEVFGHVVERLGAANYSKDAQLIASADPKELERIYTNFVADELKVQDRVAAMKLITKAVTKMKPIKRKYRAVFYYILTQLQK